MPLKNFIKMRIVILTVISLFLSSEGYKILAIFPHTGKSHHIMFEPLLRTLAEKGHELSVVSHYPLENPPPTYHDVSVAGSMHLNVHICDFDDFLFLSGVGSILRHIMATYELFDLGNLNCNAMTSHKNVQDLMNGNQTFDVIITEQFNSDCSFGLIKKFKAPVIGIATHVPMPWTRERFGIPNNPSFVPNHFLKHLRSPTFFDTVESLLVNTYYKMVYYINTHIFEYRFLGRGFLESRRDLDEIARNMSMLFVTTYFPLHGAMLQGPNVVDIGGVHLPKRLNVLDSNIEKFVNESENGVIYFSMGSMIRGKSLPLHKLKAFQEAFNELPYRVLWKWENDTMPGKSDNILIRPWMPQYEIISHPMVKAFICHGGLLGLTEAVNRGVPVLVIPFFGDQFVNGAAAEESGLGRVLPYEDITKESVLAVLKDLLDPKMQESAKRISSIWRDRLSSPLDTAVYWVEHIARHGGTHLRPVSADLPLYRYLLLDVLAFLILLLIIFVYSLKMFFTWRTRTKSKTE